MGVSLQLPEDGMHLTLPRTGQIGIDWGDILLKLSFRLLIHTFIRKPSLESRMSPSKNTRLVDLTQRKDPKASTSIAMPLQFQPEPLLGAIQMRSGQPKSSLGSLTRVELLQSESRRYVVGLRIDRIL